MEDELVAAKEGEDHVLVHANTDLVPLLLAGPHAAPPQLSGPLLTRQDAPPRVLQPRTELWRPELRRRDAPGDAERRKSLRHLRPRELEALDDDIAIILHLLVLEEASPLDVGHPGDHLAQEEVDVLLETLQGRSLGRRRAVREGSIELSCVSVAQAADVDDENLEEEPRLATCDAYRAPEVPHNVLYSGAGINSASDVCLLHGGQG